VPSIYQPRRPRASPLWQILTAAWDTFLASYEKKHRPTLGPLRPNVFTAVRNFLRCGDLASGFLRFHCSDCGHERLLAFTCKGRHLCPACHQRRVRQTADWIATAVCHEVPHRQFVFTIPKILRGIFRKRRDLLHLLFKTATDTLQEIFRTRLNLPDGKLGAIAAVHTFGDYLIFHPHLHVLAAHGLFTPDGRFHCMPAEDLAPAIELFRHCFLQALRDGKHISPSRLAVLLSWKHSGFNIHDGGEKPVPAHDTEGRKRLAEYLLRHPFSLQKITWNATTQTVIYRSKRHHTTKRNFEIFKAPDFIAAVRYYGLYSNKTRGQQPLIPDRIIRPPESSHDLKSPISDLKSEVLLIPAPPKQSARSMRPLWRDLILKVWGADPLQCPCCKAPMKLAGAVKRPEQIEFFLRLHGLWEGLIQLPRPPPPPFDIETMEPIEPPWQAIKEWIPDDEPDLDWFNRPRNPHEPDPDWFDQTQAWKAPEIHLDDGRILVLEYT
jgi:hypothetical protein